MKKDSKLVAKFHRLYGSCKILKNPTVHDAAAEMNEMIYTVRT